MGNVLGIYFRIRTCSLIYGAKSNSSHVSSQAFIFIGTLVGIKDEPSGTPVSTFLWF